MNRRRSPLMLLPLASLFFAAAAPAEPLGRLFFTPAQRAALDRQRQGETSPALGKVMTIQGSVARSGRRGTVWIDGQALHETGSGNGFAVAVVPGAPARVHIVAVGDKPVQLRVGESLDRGSGIKHDLVATDAVVVHAAGKPAR